MKSLKVVLVVLTCLFFVMNIFAQTADEYYKKGLAEYEAGDMSGAIANFTRAIKLNPDFAEAYYRRGNAKLAKEDYEGAIADYKLAIKLNPKLAEPVASEEIKIKQSSMDFYNQALAKKTSGLSDEALALCSKAIQKDSNNFWAYDVRGDIYRDRLQYEKAIADYGKAYEIKKSVNPFLYDIDYLNKRGYCYLQLLEYQEALADFNLGIALSYKLNIAEYELDVFINRGNTYQYLGLYEKSIADYTKAIENATPIKRKRILGTAYNQRGISYQLAGDREKALADFKSSCEWGDETGCDNYNSFGK
ncbi:MAG: tetratricopeptide repeat protein [Spirochaetales bacterium]|nr:tetratricopeptide repeat protein [Spirochaetales bacterium]